MKTHPVSTHWSHILLSLAFLLTTLFQAPQVHGITLKTFDTTGLPVQLDDMVQKDPAIMTRVMEEELMRGNLSAAARIAKDLLVKTPDEEIPLAISAMSLITRGELNMARQTLTKLTPSAPSLYALCAEAMLRHREGRLEKAEALCHKASKRSPLHPYPHNILGRIYFDRHEYKKAADEFTQAITLAPDFQPGYANLGAVAFVQNDFHQAASHFEKAVVLNPQSHSALYGLASALEALGDNRKAINTLKACIALKKDDVHSLKTLYKLQISTGSPDGALETAGLLKKIGDPGADLLMGQAALLKGDIKAARRHLKNAPVGSIQKEYLTGYCQIATGDHANALLTMTSILSDAPGHKGAQITSKALDISLGNAVSTKEIVAIAEPNVSLPLINFIAGTLHASQANWSEALVFFNNTQGVIGGFEFTGLSAETLAHEACPEQYKTMGLSVLCQQMGMNQTALQMTDKLTTLCPESILANYIHGQLLARLGQKESAVSYLQASLTHAPQFFSSLYSLGDLCHALEKSQDAIVYYERARTIKKDTGLLIKLGLLYESQQAYEDAEEVYNTIISVSPDLFIGYNQLAWLYAQRAVKLDKALEVVAKSNQLQPNNASVLDTYGWIYFQQKKYDKALEYLTQAKGINPQSPTILYHLGMTHYALADKDAARQCIGEALALSPHFNEAENARKTLSKL